MRQSKKELAAKLTNEILHTSYSNREWNRATTKSARLRVRNNSVTTTHPSEKKGARIRLWHSLERSARLNTRKDLIIK